MVAIKKKTPTWIIVFGVVIFYAVFMRVLIVLVPFVKAFLNR